MLSKDRAIRVAGILAIALGSGFVMQHTEAANRVYPAANRMVAPTPEQKISDEKAALMRPAPVVQAL